MAVDTLVNLYYTKLLRERIGFWCPSWTSNPVLPVTNGQGGFDSHTFPPFRINDLRHSTVYPPDSYFIKRKNETLFDFFTPPLKNRPVISYPESMHLLCSVMRS